VPATLKSRLAADEGDRLLIAAVADGRAAEVTAGGPFEGAVVTTYADPVPVMNGAPAALGFVRRLLASIARQRPDVVIAWGVNAGVASALVWREAGARHFVWYQPEAEAVVVHQRALGVAIERTPRFFAADAYAAGYLIDTLDVPGTRVVIAERDIDLWPRVLSERPAIPALAGQAPDLRAIFGGRSTRLHRV
jgi:hypothetical protein